MQHLISVIVPVYNAEAFVGATIDSVLQQTYANWELLLVDDCSTDNSATIIREYAEKDSRIKYFKPAQNFGGPAGPRNMGIRESSGEYLAFLDADDIWMKDKLQRQYQLITTEQLDVVATNIVFFGDGLKSWSPKLPASPTLDAMLLHNKICTSSVLLRKTTDVLFEEDKRLISVEDYHLWLTLFFKGYKVKIITDPLVRYRVTPNSLIHKNEFISILKANYVVSRLVVDFKYINWILMRVFFRTVKNLAKLRVKKIVGK
ncbi:glycosyltransferase involved in cell wall biosynthesis [Chitinophaga niastensis]|uniref:Glycosyltransferase involved in cell wall biosynthesis n=1 Tax=Chitinophaga niastensis TaxID=536980 RepID=A0A2P8HRT2_CHINA|nr:glycosyltransferase family 2 protein [Chitinophaga niastensis]PSL48936.1 glycosyltransferase involved in cell wall biosynthesis [Chitinophaga niastensis]